MEVKGLLSARTLSDLVVSILRGREEFPEMLCLVASSLGHLRGQDSTVCGSSLQRGHMRVCGGVEDQFDITERFSFFNYTLFPPHARVMRLIDVIKQEMMTL